MDENKTSINSQDQVRVWTGGVNPSEPYFDCRLYSSYDPGDICNVGKPTNLDHWFFDKPVTAFCNSLHRLYCLEVDQ